MAETTHIRIIGLGKIGGNARFTDDGIHHKQIATRQINFVNIGPVVALRKQFGGHSVRKS